MGLIIFEPRAAFVPTARSVSTTPGYTPVTAIPARRTSSRTASVRPRAACLLAAYVASAGGAIHAEDETTLTIWPPLRSRGMASCMP